MIGRRRRVVPGNEVRYVASMFVPDAWSLSTAGSMAIANNTYSPMAAGTSPYGRGSYTGDPGYGVNRFAGLTPPLQVYYSLVKEVPDPAQFSLGIGYGASGQPGMPSTGDDDGIIGPGPGPGWGS